MRNPRFPSDLAVASWLGSSKMRAGGPHSMIRPSPKTWTVWETRRAKCMAWSRQPFMDFGFSILDFGLRAEATGCKAKGKREKIPTAVKPQCLEQPERQKGADGAANSLAPGKRGWLAANVPDE